MIRMVRRVACTVIYKSILVGKLCYHVMYQGIINNFATYSSSVNKYKKYIIGSFIGLALLLHLWPSWLKLDQNHVPNDLSYGCISSKISSLRKSFEEDDVVVKHWPLEIGETDYIVHVGNGYIGTAVGEKERLHVFRSRTLSLDIPYYPNVVVDITGFSSVVAYATNIREGIVSKVQCFTVGKYTVTVETQIYAHRNWPSLLVQEFSFHNPSDTAVTLDISRQGTAGTTEWRNVTTANKRMTDQQKQIVEYSIVSGTVPVPDGQQELAVVIASVILPDSITIEKTSSSKFQILTAVQYKNGSVPVPGETKNQLFTTAEEQLVKALEFSSKSLRDQHSQLWETLWHSGFSISHSKAPGAINGEHVNMTMYYVLSHSPTILNSNSINATEKYRLEKLLYYPQHRCYEGHATLQTTKLWALPKDLETMLEHVRVWKVTLEKQGCSTLLEAGAAGVLQAMILSLGSFQFKNDHLEFRTLPSDLHRNFFFRRISYGNNTHLNISVLLNTDNKARIYVALDRNDRPYYACDAGCIDDPIKLSANLVEFPVKLTAPITAILYVTADEAHMKELKHAIHVKEIAEAPAHEHDIIAIHRHGHHLGGLPLLFWASITFLIILFHVFLFKLVYNEYCNADDAPRYQRGRYQV